MKQLKLASLFAGCGGTDLGFQGGFSFLGKKYKRHPVKLVYSNEIEKGFADIYDSNFNHKTHIKDIKKISHKEIPECDILTGGFPCLTFSIVAQFPPRLGLDGKTGTLYEDMCKAIRAKQPKCFVAENVKGLLSANKRKAFPIIMRDFRSCGYHVVHLLLNAYDYGVPQKRERVFIIGFKEARYLDFFRPPQQVFDKSSLGLVLEDEVPEKYYFSKRALEGLKKANKKMNKGRVQDIKGPCNTVGSHLAKVSINSTDPVLLINGRYRRFTPREVARIQSFPDTFDLIGSDGIQYRALGNAIPPVLAWHVCKSVVNAINDAEVFEKNSTKI